MILSLMIIFISIHALLAESDPRFPDIDYCKKISIHALLAESDRNYGKQHNVSIISIHALLAESDASPKP